MKINSLWNAQTMSAKSNSMIVISNKCWMKKWRKSIKNTLWNSMPTWTEIQYLGAQLLIANTCFSFKKTMMYGLNAPSAKNSTASTAELTGIKIWLANNIKSQTLIAQQMMHLWSSWRGRNLNSALNASFGWKRIRVVIIWPANANSSSATSVEGYTVNANAWKSTKKICREGSSSS